MMLDSGNVLEISPPFTLSMDKDGVLAVSIDGAVYAKADAMRGDIDGLDVVKSALKMIQFMIDRMEQSA